MRRLGICTLMLAAVASTAHGHGLRLGDFTLDINGFGGGRGHGGFRLEFGGGGGHGFGLGSWGLGGGEFLQGRFEDKLDDLMMEYDDGVAEIEDYYNSEEYEDVVDDTERLSDRYGRFLNGVDSSIDWLDLSIDRLNEKSDYLNDLLTELEADDDISAERLERVTDWINIAQDFLTVKIDHLTEKQTMLADNLLEYQDFDTEITSFLDTIIAAGEDPNAAAAEVVASLMSSESLATALSVSAAGALVSGGPSVVAAVPEPAGAALLVAGILAAQTRIGRRRRRIAA